ncbi:hypothetical protein FISHEDRAFT_76682 [Fistulina hepatica ATCC 64428]|uniref:GH16 domain-containing protein n=1 Tax=Fistulina hepatica ATCC 64428 TaxID=1128425 RepID=A0A0D7A451_9AGAR|nr:hypothetical protein FISHEDRAFT_76682 [Fistulina hepatica ATCC 64428]
MRYHRTLLLALSFAFGTPTLAGASIVSNAFNRVHALAAHHTHSFARDLRIAFSRALIAPRDDEAQHTLYCIVTDESSLAGSSSGSSGGGSKSSATVSATSTSASATSTLGSSPWKVNTTYEGSDFFTGWDFWTSADPTNGVVDYIDEDDAYSDNLIEIDDNGHVFLRVETTQTVSDDRKSIRITTQQSWNGMLLIMDAYHMPTGCGTWPAFWTDYGITWPAGGEIDIVEGVNNFTHNQFTIHTSVGCTIPSDNSTVLNITGTVLDGTDCASADTDNQGCGILETANNSFGVPFNEANGGAFAMLWDSDGIATWFFSRDNIPDDIENSVPRPTTWGEPGARWPATDCNMSEFFYDQVAIFDTTLCGDWAGEVWNDTSSSGQEQSCNTLTGYATCEEFVRNAGNSFAEAYWEIQYVRIYQYQD